jgi:hypothetical protein
LNRAELGTLEGEKYVVLTMCQAKESAIGLLKSEQPIEVVPGT